jgi:polyhydroxyalkanoate synthesis regulator phasin
MKDFFRKSMLFGVGLAMATREKVESVVDDMIARGEMSEKEGKETVHALIEKSEEVKKDLMERVDELVQDVLKRLRIPSREEWESLKAKVDALEGKGAPEKKEPAPGGNVPGE